MNARRKRIRKKRVQTLLSILFLLILLGLALFLFQKPVVVLSENTRFPVGERVELMDLIREVKNGTLVNENEGFEAQSACTRTVQIKIKSRLGRIVEESFTIEFYDNTAPVISHPDQIAVMKGETTDLMANVSAKDETGEACQVTLSGEYDFNVAGEYKLTLSAADRAGNSAVSTMTLTVRALPYDDNGKLVDGVYTTRNGFELIVKDGIATIDGHIIANKSYSLPKTYTSSWMSPETTAAYNKMNAEAKKAGITLKVDNAYRSWYDQDYIFRGYAARDGVEEAETYSARPGHSEHQTGLAMDLITSSTYLASLPENAKKFQWLNENAHRFGFILRYPEGKTEETGYIYEAWHFRYVGEDLARTLYNNGDWITMEAYYGITSSYLGYTK